MASNLNTTTLIHYYVFGKSDKRTMSIGTPHAATYAKRMIGQRAWTSATIEDVEQNGKLQASMNAALPTNHVDASPHLFELAAHSKKLETASVKRLVTEAEREKLLLHTLEAVKALGMSNGRVIAMVSQVYPAPIPSIDVATVPAQESLDHLPTKPIINTSPPAPAPVHVPEQKGGISNPFKR